MGLQVHEHAPSSLSFSPAVPYSLYSFYFLCLFETGSYLCFASRFALDRACELWSCSRPLPTLGRVFNSCYPTHNLDACPRHSSFSAHLRLLVSSISFNQWQDSHHRCRHCVYRYGSMFAPCPIPGFISSIAMYKLDADKKLV